MKSMKKQKVFAGFILFGLGIIGILSLLTMEIPLPPEAEAILQDRFTPQQIKLLILINPVLFLSVAVVIGTVLYQKVNLKIPLIGRIAGVESGEWNGPDILKYGIAGGVLSGILLGLVSLLFNPILPAEFHELGQSLEPSLAARFLYGGFTEEILMRFGLMTFIVWITSVIIGGTKPIVYWIGIILSSVIFAAGHFPIAFQAVDNPSIAFLTYILIGNTTGGLIFGWLYWKKGLESAILAHIITHLLIVLAEPILR